MSTLLDIHVLPSGKRSRTRAVRESFLEAYREANDGHRIIERDLVADHAELPAFDEWDIQSRFEMLYGEGTLDAMGAERWEALSQATDQLHCADVVLISAPMWNFSVPWHLKRWIDA
ncbi:MAG: NAD(P)H-dependent oxidoreductase, partial [Myxococcales bacterium]|nr:NAD(P)H-dependent oxidoreductase [Myxococcales bacterium]